MDAKKIILLVVALIVAGGTAFMARSLFSQSSAPQAQAAAMPAPKNGPEILVATRALPVGTIIEADSFRYQPWPKDLIENAYFLKGQAEPASLTGTVVRSQVTAGQPITKGALVKPGDRGFLAAALGPGMRAVTVSVSSSSGGAGFVFPGDRVDLVLAQKGSLSVADEDIGEVNAAETFVRNVRVLATDQRTSSEDADGKKEVKAFSTVTIEVTPRMAEKVSAAIAMGQISLSLRSIADTTADLEHAIASGEVSMPANGDPKAEKKIMTSFASRPTDASSSFVSSGDVSTFAKKMLQISAASAARKALKEGRAAAAAAGARGGLPDISAGPVVKIRRGSNKDPEVISVGSN